MYEFFILVWYKSTIILIFGLITIITMGIILFEIGRLLIARIFLKHK